MFENLLISHDNVGLPVIYGLNCKCTAGSKLKTCPPTHMNRQGQCYNPLVYDQFKSHKLTLSKNHKRWKLVPIYSIWIAEASHIYATRSPPHFNPLCSRQKHTSRIQNIHAFAFHIILSCQEKIIIYRIPNGTKWQLLSIGSRQIKSHSLIMFLYHNICTKLTTRGQIASMLQSTCFERLTVAVPDRLVHCVPPTAQACQAWNRCSFTNPTTHNPSSLNNTMIPVVSFEHTYHKFRTLLLIF